MASNDRLKVFLMFAAVVIVCGGGAFYFFKVHQPNARLADAREEIAGWDLRWTATRDCLLGATPGSSKVSEALAIRELAPDPWDRKTCTQLVSQLSRGEATDTRVPAVEAAWLVMDKAASRVALSFLSHVDPGGDPRGKKTDPLPVALDELELAYAALRGAAELPPAAPPAGTTAPLPAAAIVPVELAGQRILSVLDPPMTSRAGLLAYGTSDGHEVQLELVAGQPPTTTIVGAGMQRALPDGTWGARALPDSIEVGQLDDQGAWTAAPAVLALPGATQVIAAVGTWADGVVVYGAGNQLVVARGKSGAFTPDKPLTVRSMAFAIDAATGDTVIAFADDTSAMSTLRLGPATLAATPEPLGREGFPKLMCLAADAAYLQAAFEGSDQLLELRPGSQTAITTDTHTLIGCSPGGALVRRYGAQDYRRCVKGACEPVLIGTRRDSAPAVVTANGVAAVETRGGVLVVRVDRRDVFYAIPNGLVAIGAMTDGNVLDVLGWTADGLVIARVAAH